MDEMYRTSLKRWFSCLLFGAIFTILLGHCKLVCKSQTLLPAPWIETRSPLSSSKSSLPALLNATRRDANSAAEGDAASPKLLCVHFKSRLGNQLFQYASTLGLAMTLHRTPVFLDMDELRPVLKHSPRILADDLSLLKARCSNATVVEEAACCKFDEALTLLDTYRDFLIGKYLQSYRYFEEHEAAIRQAIVFSDDILNETSSVVRQLRHQYNGSTLIGVHIRRGDMDTTTYRRMGYTVPSREYVSRSLAFFRDLYPGCVFVVASDSLKWCKANFPLGYHVHYLPMRAPAVDMSVIAAMDHTIISFGTFSWWIGFLNAGKTVYMKNYIKLQTELGREFNPGGKDLIYPDWIPL